MTDTFSMEELEAESIAELPNREAMTLLDPGLVTNLGSTGLLGTDQTTGTTGGLTDQSAATASGLSGPVSQSAADAAAAQSATTQTYQPSVSSVAQS